MPRTGNESTPVTGKSPLYLHYPSVTFGVVGQPSPKCKSLDHLKKMYKLYTELLAFVNRLRTSQNLATKLHLAIVVKRSLKKLCIFQIYIIIKRLIEKIAGITLD